MLDKNIENMSGTEILNNTSYYDFRHATNEDLQSFKNALVKLTTMANKRAKRLKESGRTLPYDIPHFSVKNIENVNDAKKVYRDVRLFLLDKSKSLSGMNYMRRRSTSRLEEEVAKSKTFRSRNKKLDEMWKWLRDPNKYDKFWRTWSELQKLMGGIPDNVKYDVLITMYEIWSEQPVANMDDILIAMEGETEAIMMGFDSYTDMLIKYGYISPDDFGQEDEENDLRKYRKKR